MSDDLKVMICLFVIFAFGAGFGFSLPRTCKTAHMQSVELEDVMWHVEDLSDIPQDFAGVLRWIRSWE